MLRAADDEPDTRERKIDGKTGKAEAMARQAYERESAAFEDMLPSLLKTHGGQFVAIRDGRTIDQDLDEFSLTERIWRDNPHRFTLIRQVLAGPPFAEEL